MRTLLLPGIRLMNRLSYLNKFILISLIFIIPLLVLGALQAREFYEAQQATARKLQGLEVLRRAQALNRDLADYRDLRSLLAVPGLHPTAIRDEMEQRLEGPRQRIASALEHLEARQPESASLQQLQQDWRQLEQQGFYASEADIHAVYDAYHRLVLANRRLIRQLATESTLAQDPDPFNFALLRILLESAPAITSELGQARAYGIRAVVVGSLSSALIDSLDRLYKAMRSTREQFGETLEFIPASAPGLAPLATRALEGFNEALQRLDADIMLGETLDVPWQPYYDAFSHDLDAFDDLLNSGLERVADNLEVRLQAQQRRLTTLLAGLALVLLLSGYCYLGFNLSVRDNIARTLSAARRLAQGDLTVQIDVNARDEMGDLTAEFNRMVEHIHALILEVRETALAVAQRSDTVSVVARDGNKAALEQNRQTEQAAVAINQLATGAQAISDIVLQASAQAQAVDRQARQGHEQVERTLEDIQQLAGNIDNSMQAIDRLAADSHEIAGVLDVIRGIAEQTNLLALNAAIEAARAGDQGRGFAVVADEVRGLAQRTHAATLEIEQMITRLQRGVIETVDFMAISHQRARQTVEASGRVGSSLQEITAAIGTVVGMNTRIAAASDQQAATSQEIDRSILRISTSSQQVVEGSNHTAQDSVAMAALADKLQQRVATFRLKD
ncbi:methyl-accepting chemotaxis protein [Marinobacterium aestuariivivens]|uniref:Methyl-accepting chemotaxis protein n=1 Tax=Marinobacterium aestuariivivens TaxID=1698799 RepID=A0ABW2A3S8_9GAMM